jgi:hypothetical protein
VILCLEDSVVKARTVPCHPALFQLALLLPASLHSVLVPLPLALPRVRAIATPSAAKVFKPALLRTLRAQAPLLLVLFPLVPCPPALLPRALPVALAVSDRDLKTSGTLSSSPLAPLLPVLPIPDPLAVVRVAVTVVVTAVMAKALARFLPALLLLEPLPLALREVSVARVRSRVRARVHSPPASLHLAFPLLSLLLEASTIF